MKYEASTHTPVQARTIAPIRFADIDRYGIVSTDRYVEYLFTSRFDYVRDQFGVMPETFIKKGVGFVTRRMEWEFYKPIMASQSHVAIESFTPLIEDSKFIVSFKIRHPEGEPIYASGTAEFRCIDTKTGQLVPMPEWLLRCFYILPDAPATT